MTPTDRRGSHGYLPQEPDLHTGLVISGAGVTPGAALGTVEMVDVAPTLARLLGIELGGTEGRPLEAALAGS